MNLAARITSSAADEGSLTANADRRDAAGDGFDWSEAGRRALKGIEEEVELFRADRSAA